MAGLTGGGVSSRSAYQPIVYTEKANFYLEAAASHTHRTAIGHLSDGVARQALRRVSADSCTAGKRPLGDQQTSDVARSLATGPAIGCPRSAREIMDAAARSGDDHTRKNCWQARTNQSDNQTKG
jgi:hypothetical protein